MADEKSDLEKKVEDVNKRSEGSDCGKTGVCS